MAENETLLYQIQKNYYQKGTPEHHAFWREVAARVYANALKNPQIDLLELHTKFDSIRSIAASTASTLDEYAAEWQAIKNVSKQLYVSTIEPMDPRNSLMTLAKTVSNGPLENLKSAISQLQASRDQVLGMVEHKTHLLSMETRERLSALYDLPYKQRIQALRSLDLADDLALDSILVLPGRAMVNSTTQAAGRSFNTLGQLGRNTSNMIEHAVNALPANREHSLAPAGGTPMAMASTGKLTSADVLRLLAGGRAKANLDIDMSTAEDTALQDSSIAESKNAQLSSVATSEQPVPTQFKGMQVMHTALNEIYNQALAKGFVPDYSTANVIAACQHIDQARWTGMEHSPRYVQAIEAWKQYQGEGPSPRERWLGALNVSLEIQTMSDKALQQGMDRHHTLRKVFEKSPSQLDADRYQFGTDLPRMSTRAFADDIRNLWRAYVRNPSDTDPEVIWHRNRLPTKNEVLHQFLRIEAKRDVPDFRAPHIQWLVAQIDPMDVLSGTNRSYGLVKLKTGTPSWVIKQWEDWYAAGGLGKDPEQVVTRRTPKFLLDLNGANIINQAVERYNTHYAQTKTNLVTQHDESKLLNAWGGSVTLALDEYPEKPTQNTLPKPIDWVLEKPIESGLGAEKMDTHLDADELSR
jgi:hypothetical protein